MWKGDVKPCGAALLEKVWRHKKKCDVTNWVPQMTKNVTSQNWTRPILRNYIFEKMSPPERPRLVNLVGGHKNLAWRHKKCDVTKLDTPNFVTSHFLLIGASNLWRHTFSTSTGLSRKVLHHLFTPPKKAWHRKSQPWLQLRSKKILTRRLHNFGNGKKCQSYHAPIFMPAKTCPTYL